MAQEQYEVEAHLRLLTGNAQNAATRLGTTLTDIGRRISGAESAGGGLVRQLVGMGAAYVGINALVGGFQRLVGSAVQYQQELEGMSISLSAVISAVDGIPFERARQQSGRLFEELRQDALTSVATTRDLFGIAQMLYGPLHGAGLGMEEIRGFTRDTVTASTALGIDLDFASREMQMLINGAAGMHVRLFQMLRSTGAIVEDAQAWNRLSTPERIQRLQSALGRFSTAADAYGQSFAGVSSTFQDIVENFMSVFFGPGFDRLRRFLNEVNTRLLANRDAMSEGLRQAGEWAAERLGTAFDTILMGMDYLSSHWDEIVAKGRAFIDQVRALLPALQSIAQSWVAISLARSVLGGGMQVAGGLVGLAGGFGMAPAATAAAGAEGAAATGGLGAIGVALEALAPLALPLAAALAVVASVVEVVVNHWNAFLSVAEPLVNLWGTMTEELGALGSDLWDILQPVMELVGTAGLYALVGLFVAVVMGVRAVIFVFRLILDPLARLGRVIQQEVGPAVDYLVGLLGETADFLFGARAPHEAEGPFQVEITNMEELASYIGTGIRDAFSVEGELAGTNAPDAWQHIGWAGTAPDARTQVHNDFRGSRITVHQEFREADPDRVLMQMMSDIHSQAESRLTSGYAPPLTR